MNGFYCFEFPTLVTELSEEEGVSCLLLSFGLNSSVPQPSTDLAWSLDLWFHSIHSPCLAVPRV